MDDPIGLLNAEKLLPGQDLRRKHLRHLIQALTQHPQNQLAQNLAGEPGGQRVDGHNAAGIHRGGIIRLRGGIRHLTIGLVAGQNAIEVVLLSVFQASGTIALIEVGNGQNARVVRHPDAGERAPSVVGVFGLGDDAGADAGRDVRLQIRNGRDPASILIAPGEVGKQVIDCPDAQGLQLLGALRAHTPQGADRILKRNHQIRATPLARAASETAFATAGQMRLSKAWGRI